MGVSQPISVLGGCTMVSAAVFSISSLFQTDCGSVSSCRSCFPSIFAINISITCVVLCQIPPNSFVIPHVSAAAFMSFPINPTDTSSFTVWHSGPHSTFSFKIFGTAWQSRSTALRSNNFSYAGSIAIGLLLSKGLAGEEKGLLYDSKNLTHHGSALSAVLTKPHSKVIEI